MVDGIAVAHAAELVQLAPRSPGTAVSAIPKLGFRPMFCRVAAASTCARWGVWDNRVGVGTIVSAILFISGAW